MNMGSGNGWPGDSLLSRMEASDVADTFSDLQLKILDEARFGQKTKAINRRVNAVYFRGCGRTQREAAQLAKVSLNTLRKAVATFESGGLAAWIADAREGPPSALDTHAEIIKAEFTARPPPQPNPGPSCPPKHWPPNIPT